MPGKKTGLIWFLIFAAVGLFLMFRPVLLSGFRLGIDPGDTKLNQYILEHSYLWLIGNPIHSSYWNPPFYYPELNVMAYGDVLLGTAPLFWVFRILGFLPDVSFLLWLFAISLLNFTVAYFFLKRVFRTDALGSAAGAFFFSFASPRICQVNHQQLLPQFFTLLTIWALAELFSSEKKTPRAERLWISVFFASWVLQQYAGFYLGWFLTFAVYLAGWVTLFSKSKRARLFEFFRDQWWFTAVAGVVSIVVLWPMAWHYSNAAALVGTRAIESVKFWAPRPASWFYLGPYSWFYSWLDRLPGFSVLPAKDEQRLGIGFLATVLVAWTLFRKRREAIWNYFWHVGILIVILATLTTDWLWPWYFAAFKTFPGASGIRALSRIGLLLLIPATAAIASFFSEKRGWAVSLLLCAIVLEQGQWLSSLDLQREREITSEIAQAIPKTCKSFALIADVDPRTAIHPDFYYLDAMAASDATGIPTVDGRSGNFPPGWWLPVRSMDENQFPRALNDWMRTKELASADVCTVRVKVKNPIWYFPPVAWSRYN